MDVYQRKQYFEIWIEFCVDLTKKGDFLLNHFFHLLLGLNFENLSNKWQVSVMWIIFLFSMHQNVRELKVSKSRKQLIVFSILPKSNKTHYPEHLLFSKYAQDSVLRSFFGRIENSINYFRDILTLSFASSFIWHLRVVIGTRCFKFPTQALNCMYSHVHNSPPFGLFMK